MKLERVVPSASFPEPAIEIVTSRSLTDFNKDFALLSDDFTQTHAGRKFRGLASGYFVQEAHEGEHGISDIHYDLTGLNSVLLQTHAGSELRSVIAHVRAFHPRQVDIHFRTQNGAATIRRDGMGFGGAPLRAVPNGWQRKVVETTFRRGSLPNTVVGHALRENETMAAKKGRPTVGPAPKLDEGTQLDRRVNPRSLPPDHREDVGPAFQQSVSHSTKMKRMLQSDLTDQDCSMTTPDGKTDTTQSSFRKVTTSPGLLSRLRAPLENPRKYSYKNQYCADQNWPNRNRSRTETFRCWRAQLQGDVDQ